MEFVTKEPVRIDILAHERMGDENSGGLEALVKANRNLANSEFAPQGATIVIPPKPAQPAAAAVNPWD